MSQDPVRGPKAVCQRRAFIAEVLDDRGYAWRRRPCPDGQKPLLPRTGRAQAIHPGGMPEHSQGSFTTPGKPPHRIRPRRGRGQFRALGGRVRQQSGGVIALRHIGNAIPASQRDACRPTSPKTPGSRRRRYDPGRVAECWQCARRTGYCHRYLPRGRGEKSAGISFLIWWVTSVGTIPSCFNPNPDCCGKTLSQASGIST